MRLGDSILWLADLDVNAFLGDLSGDTWDVDLSDRPGPLVVRICEHAEGHEHSRQKYTRAAKRASVCRKGNKSSATCLLVEAGPKLRREAPMPDDKIRSANRIAAASRPSTGEEE